MSSDLSGITKLFVSDPGELITLKRHVINDIFPDRGTVDAIYCVGGTVDTQDQDLQTGAKLWQAGHAHVVGVLRGTTKYGYCGFEFCRNQLIASGVRENAIVPVDMLPQDSDNLNTYTEGKALVSYARLNGWKTIIVCAPFFHQIRASSTFISLLDKHHPQLWIFNQPGEPANMKERVKHSQGVVEGDLLELFISEFGRLFRYHNQGDIYSCSDLIAYYGRRNYTFFLRKLSASTLLV